MRKRMICITAVCLVLAMLTGCTGLADYLDRISQLLGFTMTSFEDMVYTRPDMEHFRQVLEKSCTDAEKETDFDDLQSIILDFYGAYESFYTNYCLASIYYSKDLTDSYWQAENTFCTENGAEVDAGLDRLYRILAKSPLRDKLEGEDYFGPDFFDSYDGESVYDETFNGLLARETELINRYYAISGESVAAAYYSDAYFEIYGTQLAAVFRDLVQVRQEMAAYTGYDSYPEFAYDFHHARDYTVAQADAYLQQIQTQLTPLYRRLNQSDYWSRDGIFPRDRSIPRPDPARKRPTERSCARFCPPGSRERVPSLPRTDAKAGASRECRGTIPRLNKRYRIRRARRHSARSHE